MICRCTRCTFIFSSAALGNVCSGNPECLRIHGSVLLFVRYTLFLRLIFPDYIPLCIFLRQFSIFQVLSLIISLLPSYLTNILTYTMETQALNIKIHACFSLQSLGLYPWTSFYSCSFLTILNSLCCFFSHTPFSLIYGNSDGTHCAIPCWFNPLRAFSNILQIFFILKVS